MNVKQILRFVPDELLDSLAVETGVDYKVKKLEGVVVFKLLLYSMLQVKHNSLRVMASIFNSYAFKKLNGEDELEETRFNSISDRLSSINPLFFERIYKDCIWRFFNEFESSNPSLLRFDSTLLSVSAKLIGFGFQSGGRREHLKTLKFTIGYSDIPEHAAFYHDASHNSENVALKEAVLSCKASKEKIVLFDQGVQSRNTYDEFEDEEILFVTRVNPNPLCTVIEGNSLTSPIETPTLVIDTQKTVRLINRKGRRTRNVFRYIARVQKETSEPIAFITNIAHLGCEEITDLYRQRWDIEVFFKFIKQELNFSHLINRSENGIKVMLYATLILSILLTVYKKKNNLRGFKHVKLQFAQELEMELIKHIIVLYGGDPRVNPQKSQH